MNRRFISLLAISVVAVGMVTSGPVFGGEKAGDTGSSFVQRFAITYLEGSIDPVTYTDQDGTFSITAMDLALSPGEPSTVSINTSTSVFSSHLVLVASFNNGKPGPLNEDLVGTITVEESGVLLPGSDPFCQQVPGSTACVESTIMDGELSGAGPFAGTKVKGKNPTFFPPADPPPQCDDGQGGVTVVKWEFSPPDSPPDILLELPSPPFTGDTEVPVHGTVDVCVVSSGEVGGVAESLPSEPDSAPLAAAEGSGSSASLYVAIAGGAALLVVLLAGGAWYARRRWVR